MSDSMIRNCPWGYSCTKEWADLSDTRDEDIRFCTDCQKEVHWVDSREELAESVLLNRCVSFRALLIDSILVGEEISGERDGSITLTGLATPDILDYEPTQGTKKDYDPLNDFDDDDIPF